jgi:hypothetical protein
MSRTDHTHTLNFNQELNIEKIDIGHFARLQTTIFESKLSDKAVRVVATAISLCSPQKPSFWINQHDFANRLGMHISTLKRILKELLKLGVFVATKRWQFGRYKIYQMDWNVELSQNVEKAAPSTDELPHSSPVSYHVAHPRATNNRVDNQSKKQQTGVSATKIELAEAKSETAQAMLKTGLSKESVVDLIKSKGEAECQKQIEHLHIQNQKGSTIRNAAGWLRNAICKGFATTTFSGEEQKETKKLQRIKKNHAIFEESKKYFESQNYEMAIEGAESLLAQGRHFPAAELLRNAQKALRGAAGCPGGNLEAKQLPVFAAIK